MDIWIGVIAILTLVAVAATVIRTIYAINRVMKEEEEW